MEVYGVIFYHIWKFRSLVLLIYGNRFAEIYLFMEIELFYNKFNRNMNTHRLLSIVADQREELLANDYSALCPRPEEAQLGLKSNRVQVVIGVRRSGKSTLCEMFLMKKEFRFIPVSICMGNNGSSVRSAKY